MATSYSPTSFAKSSLKSATPTGAPLPSAQVASYANQQVGNLNVGLGAATIAQSPTQVALAGAPRAQNAVQLSAQRRMDSVKASGERLTKLAQATAAKRVSARGVSGGTGGGVSTGTPVGQAYRPDGSLSASRNQALAHASSYIGSRYVLGGTTTRGIDCSGLVMMVYNRLGFNLNHSAGTQGRTMPGVRTSIANLRPGDIVAWKDGSHIAVYAGNGEIIEAANERVGTVRRKIWANPNAIYGIALRLPGE